jgi:hypothetical protein
MGRLRTARRRRLSITPLTCGPIQAEMEGGIKSRCLSRVANFGKMTPSASKRPGAAAYQQATGFHVFRPPGFET